jgi:hypothetical protein
MIHPNALRALILSALCAPSAFAQSGVLIGVSTPAGYETLWVVRDASQPLRATIPELLVPRPDGWWRLGITPICSTGGPEGQWMEVLWRVRADSTPLISEICHELPRGELPLPIYVEDSAAADSARKELVRCSWSKIRINFVSPDYLAVGEQSGQTEECEPRGGRWYASYYVSRFNGDSSLALAELSSSRVDSIGRMALSTAAKELAKDELCASIAEGFDSGEAVEIGGAWYPSRFGGRWLPVLVEQLGVGDCQLHPVVDIALDVRLTGHDALRPSWAALSKQIQGLTDGFSSPNGDMVIVRATDSLFVYLGGREKLGRRVGAVPFGGREIVMLQWATGRNVARWDREIGAMVKLGLPSPKVMVPPKDP